MLAGQFPNYDLVLPKNNDKHIPLNTERFAQSIRRAALMADERSHGIKLELTTGKINLTSQSADVGEAKEVIPVDYTGDTVSIGFNAQYIALFLRILHTMPTSSASSAPIRFRSKLRTIKVRPCSNRQETGNMFIRMWSCPCG